MTSLFPASEFDDWAASYDESTWNANGFPFDGYSDVLDTIVKLAEPLPGAAVLDLGIGTGNLSQRLVEKSCRIWGVDFSIEMLKLAQVKLPSAVLALADLRAPFPPDFPPRFDCIVSAYTFHHFPLEEKVDLVRRLMEKSLNPESKLVIGDIAFKNAASEELCRRELGDEWEQEYYWLADESLSAFNLAGIHAAYSPVSSCAGVFQLIRR